MAASIGCWVRDTAIIENKKDIEYKKAFMNSIITSNTHLDTKVPGMHKSTMLEKAFDQHTKNKQHLWIIKG
jgi:hypothetical protein